MSITRFKPWQRITVGCDRCEKTAVEIVSTPNPLSLDPDSEIVGYGCAEHAEQMLNETYVKHRASASEPLVRESWAQWFRSLFRR